jgi:DNA-binding CsgD family transcriptional regulator
MVTERARSRCRERIVALCDMPADGFSLRAAIIELLRPTIGFDRWCWPVTDPGSELGTTAIGEHDYWAALPRLLLLDQRATEANALPALTRSGALAEVTGGHLERSMRWIDVLGPRGIGDEVRVPLRDRHGLWGVLDLMRPAGDPPFAPEDRALLDQLAPILASATRRSAAAAARLAGALVPTAPAPGVVVLDRDLDVRAMTPGAREWLRQLLPRAQPFADLAAPAVIYNVASRVLARRRGAGLPRPARARVQTVTGAWAYVEGDELDGVQDGTVAVTIRAAAPAEVLDLRLLAYDLTVRQRELVGLLLDGADTKTISAGLYVSAHTVQDHLKAVFGKVGVRTRKELVATLTAQ